MVEIVCSCGLALKRGSFREHRKLYPEHYEVSRYTVFKKGENEMKDVSGYIIVRKLNDNLYMPVVNPEQKRFSIGKSVIGEFKILKNLNNAKDIYKYFINNDTKQYFILKVTIDMLLSENNEIVNAFKITPTGVVL